MMMIVFEVSSSGTVERLEIEEETIVKVQKEIQRIPRKRRLKVVVLYYFFQYMFKMKYIGLLYTNYNQHEQ